MKNSRKLITTSWILNLALAPSFGWSAQSTPALTLLGTAAPASGSVEFLARGRPSALQIRGKGPGPAGAARWTNEKLTGEFELDLDALDTGIAMRTEHMKKKYLETEKFPKARLVLDPIAIDAATAKKVDAKLENVAFHGTLTLHGMSKPVSGTASLSRAGDQATVTTHLSILLTDYGIQIPSFAGITVADQVDIDVRTQAEVKK